MRLKGKKAIITGSTGTLGGSIVEALAGAGCGCVCHYHSNSGKAEELVSKVRKAGVEGIAIQADLRREEEVARLFDQAGAVDILINSAGVFFREKIAEADIDNGRDMFEVNFVSAVITSKYFIRQLSDADEGVVGKIVNISGVGGLKPWAGYSFYCASKAALISLTGSLAKELGPRVTVNSVCPGTVSFPEGVSESVRDRQLSMIPMGRFGRAEEIGAAVLFLLENDYITGEVVRVDGGRGI